MGIVINWCKKNIKNILYNKFFQTFFRWGEKLLLFIALLTITMNIVGDEFAQLTNIDVYTEYLLKYRNNVIRIFSVVWILSLWINKKVMIVVWLCAFSFAYQQSLNIPALCNVWCQDYCIDNNCDAKVCIADRCLATADNSN